MEVKSESELRESELPLAGPSSSHQLVKIRTPQRCSHCDTLSFFLTFSCQACGLAWHKACLSQLKGACGETAAGRPGRGDGVIFGVPLGSHLSATGRDVPIVVQRCVEELDKRGRVKGLYRVCGTKSKIDWTCGAIEAGGGEGPYAEASPNVLASVLKLYLRQLPQSLFTEALTGPCLALARDFPPERRIAQPEKAELLAKLATLLKTLPRPNYNTLQYLVLHLKRFPLFPTFAFAQYPRSWFCSLTWFESETSMNAMNLGIVFGPTLMGRDEEGSSGPGPGEPLQPLLQLPVQARLIELVITNAFV